MSRHNNTGLQLLMERREREDANRFYVEAAGADMLVQQHAAFETRTFARYEAGEMKRRAQACSEKAQKDVDRRRAKLAALLKADDEKFQKELESQAETPKTRRLRLLEKLNTLRAMRQQEHDDYVRERNEQAWRDQCDPLRYQISEALEKQVIAERDKQVIAHDLAKMEDDAEEARYVQSIKESTAEWNQRLAAEAEEKRLRQLQNRKVWESEIAAHQKKAAEAKQKEYIESLEFRTTTEAAIRQAKEAAEAKAAAQAARRQELDTLNKDQITRKLAAIQAEKDLDEKYASQAAEELRQMEEDELVAKIIAQRKANLNGQLLSTQLNRKKESDDAAERYIQAAVDEVNRKEDEARLKDTTMRRQLMLDAVEDRKKAMALHLQQRKQRQQDKLEEGRQLEEELRMKKQLDQEERERKQRLINNQYQMLENQSRLKREMEARQRKEEQDEVNATIASWKAEEAKIQEELANPHFVAGNRFRGHR